MTEEQVTKSILQWLIRGGWEVVTFDFPQSGTGKLLQSSLSTGEKNKGGIIPDIIAVKDSHALYFENKDRFYLEDYRKINGLITTDEYIESINELLKGYDIKSIWYGIGMPSGQYNRVSNEILSLIHFLVGVCEESKVEILYNPRNLNFCN
jgi:hypothetical protein